MNEGVVCPHISLVIIIIIIVVVNFVENIVTKFHRDFLCTKINGVLKWVLYNWYIYLSGSLIG